MICEMTDAGHGISYSSRLPSMGLDIVLVGPMEFTKPLASALLRVQFDSRKKKTAGNEDAMEALRRVARERRKRHIYMMERLDDMKTTKTRIDHVVWVVEEDINESESKQLHHDYWLLQRVSVVVVVVVHSGTKKKSRRFFTMVHHDERSVSCVARLLLQRAKIGARQAIGVSPMLFGET